MLTFGERLLLERKKKKLSLEVMAEDLSTTKATLSRYENDLREPKLNFIKKVSDYFNCSADYLLGRTENPMYGNKNTYPYGLTHEQVIKILTSLKEAGFTWQDTERK